jgi:hypothetical protein
LPAGGEEECEIRAATVVAVERLRATAEAMEAERRGQAAAGREAGWEAQEVEEGGTGGEGVARGSGGGGGGGGDDRGGRGGGVAAAEEAKPLLSIHVDWWLWGRGEASRAEDPPHHRTLTMYY